MNEYYRVPALALLSMLLIVFALLYLQSRTARRLLWLIGWSMAVLRVAMEVAGRRSPGLGFALSNAGLVLAPLMFLGSMSPLAFRRGLKILYVYAFAAPMLLFAVLVSFYPHAHGMLRLLLILCTLAAIYVAVVWGTRRNLLSPWFSVLFSLLVGMLCIRLVYQGDYFYVLFLAQSSSNFMTALLFIAAYRRFTPGVIFTSAGLFLWSLPAVLDAIFTGPGLPMMMIGRGVNLIKVMTAVGMVLLVLEDELAQNKAAKERDHRARIELERYSAIDLSLLSDVHTEAIYQHACEVITQVSRFDQALLFLHGVENNFHVAAHSGMESAFVSGLEALGRRFTPERAEIFRQSENVTVEMGSTLHVDLRPLLEPDDGLERMQYSKAHIIPMLTRAGSIDGALFLSDLKRPEEPLSADDLLPLELLVSRLAATRENNALMLRVARSEKLAGLGHLAAGVAHELNNPLTVVLGYSELLEEALEDHPARGDMSLIRSEARRMRQIIDSMLRFWRSSPVEPVPVSVAEVLHDIYRLRRPEFDRRRVQLHLQMSDDLPQINANKNQLQQMLLHVLNNALEAFDGGTPDNASFVRVEVSHHAGAVKILVSDNGPGFTDPGRAFDPFFSTKQPRSGTGMGLSVCYAIVRDHGGEISAHNLQPRGAVVTIDLPSRNQRRMSALSSEVVAG